MGLFGVSKGKIDKWNKQRKGDKIVNALKKDAISDYAVKTLSNNIEIYLSNIANGFYSKNYTIYSKCVDILSNIKAVDGNVILCQVMYNNLVKNTMYLLPIDDEEVNRRLNIFKQKSNITPDYSFFQIMEDKLSECEYDLLIRRICTDFFIPFLELYLEDLKKDYVENLFRYIDYYFSLQLKQTYYFALKSQKDNEFEEATDSVKRIVEEMNSRNAVLKKVVSKYGEFDYSDWNTDEFSVNTTEETNYWINEIKTTNTISPGPKRIEELVSYYGSQKDTVKFE